MNIIDDVELSFLEETGDLKLAEATGTALRYTFEAAAAILGLPVEVFTAYISGDL
jgi:hypothetical protein